MTDKGYIDVGVNVDEQSFALLNTQVTTSAQQLDRFAQVNDQIAKTASDAGDRLQRAFASMKNTIDDDVNSVAALRAQLTGAADDANKVQQKGGGGSSGSGGISGLRRTGSALNQLGLGEIGRPIQLIGDVQQIANTFDQAGAKIKTLVPVLGAVDEGLIGMTAALAPIAVIVGAVAIGIKLYNDSLEASSKALGQARVALDAYYKAIDSGTTDSVQKQIDNLKRQKELIDAEAQNIQNSLNSGFESAKQQFGGDLGGRIATAGMSATNEEFRKLGDRLNELKKQSGDLDGQLQGLGTALDSAAVKANDAAAAILKAADQTREDQINQYKLIREGTTKQIQGMIADNKDIVQADTAELSTLLKESAPNEETKQRIAALRDEISKLSLQSAELTQNVLPLVSAREKETKAEQDATKAAQDRLKADEAAQQKQVDIVTKLNKDIQSAEDNAAQARIGANEKLQDALVAAAQKAVDDAQKALDQLEQKRAENLLSYQRDEARADRESADKNLDDEIKAQRQERDDLQTHLDNLKSIRDRDASRQRDDLLNRNFRDLFALGEQKNQDVQKENDRYTEQQRQRQQALDDQGADEARAFAAQRRERLISYQQQQADAVRQYEQELVASQAAKQKAISQAQAAYQRELIDLSNNLKRKEALLRQDAVNELKLTQQTEDARAQIFANMLAQAQQLLGNNSYGYTAPASKPGSSTPVPFADGGPVSAYQPALVNDGRSRESFNNSMFPPGLGVFIPVKGGYINSNGGGSSKTIHAPISIYESGNPQKTYDMVLKALKDVTR